ncbi:hypothetical protein GCM10007416_29050 [Kroppenstedtia guangzhouensis]|uniref:Amine oxidase domain-containing protein n=1 Tax=Kroppenstedtia guangzhouensis TaxID=1274356 RepID=A0ABQ1H183_9BACL|nr:hypothetical protein GCM10007416_29050 [Kroppenstedtia guangzhouensis]
MARTIGGEGEIPLEELKDWEMIQTIRMGLPRSPHPQKVLIVGAGMAGLVSASLLKGAGHRVEILEASERIGGRILTIRSPFTDGLYMEAGAMRIPASHSLVFEYLRKWGLSVNPFRNDTPMDLIYVNGVRTGNGSTSGNRISFGIRCGPGRGGKAQVHCCEGHSGRSSLFTSAYLRRESGG